MAFEETLDDYEQWQQKPDKQNHDKIFLRVDPESHRAAIITAKLQSKSFITIGDRDFEKCIVTCICLI